MGGMQLEMFFSRSCLVQAVLAQLKAKQSHGGGSQLELLNPHLQMKMVVFFKTQCFPCYSGIVHVVVGRW